MRDMLFVKASFSVSLSVCIAHDTYVKNRLTANLKDPKAFWAELQRLLPKGTKVASLNLKNDIGEDIASADASEFINQFFANVGKNLADKIPQLEEGGVVDDGNRVNQTFTFN